MSKCSVCKLSTIYNCSDCYDGFRLTIPVCGNPACNREHAKEHHSNAHITVEKSTGKWSPHDSYTRGIGQKNQ